MSRSLAASLPQSDTGPLVLLVEDSPPLAALYQTHLKGENLRLVCADTGTEALALLERDLPNLVLLDLDLPDMNGLEIMRAARHQGLSTSFVVITANGSIQNAVEAMQAGAADFLVKPFTKDRLKVTVANALEKLRLTRIVETYREESERNGLDRMIGASPVMQGVYRIVESAAPSRATVFVLGESGTGKELCAEAIHRLSPRAAKPFVAINCAAIPRELMESEIFGHVAGAFTGATKDREGAAARANGGTLFLDEICEMETDLQSKLLRFIQTQTYQRVGGQRLERADIRFVCATNRDPLAEVQAGRFREDLYYRLHVIPVEMPPLRERGEDIVTLGRQFVTRFAAEDQKHFTGLDEGAERRLSEYGWPGNVRELQNVIRHAVVLNPGPVVTESMLTLATRFERVPQVVSMVPQVVSMVQTILPAPEVVQPVAAPAQMMEMGGIKPLALVEQETINRAIELCGGDVPRAAVALGISASTIYRKKQSWASVKA